MMSGHHHRDSDLNQSRIEDEDPPLDPARKRFQPSPTHSVVSPFPAASGSGPGRISDVVCECRRPACLTPSHRVRRLVESFLPVRGSIGLEPLVPAIIQRPQTCPDLLDSGRPSGRVKNGGQDRIRTCEGNSSRFTVYSFTLLFTRADSWRIH